MSNYNNVITQPTILSFNDYANDNIDNIHKKLYDDAISKFKEDKTNGIDTNSIKYIKEIPNRKFWIYSNIVVYYLDGRRVRHQRFSLQKYWNNDFVVKNIIDIEDGLSQVDEESRNTLEIVEINYVKGNALVHSRYSGKQFILPLNNVRGLKYDVEHTLYNTFTDNSFVGNANKKDKRY